MHIRVLKESLLRWIFKHFVCQEFLEHLPMVNFLLQSIVHNKPVDLNVSLLADSKCPVSCLNVDHRVPVRIKDDHLICSSKIYAKPSDSSRQQKDEVILLIEFLDQIHSTFERDIPIHP